MMSPHNPQPNNKRYWGDEKNIDSIYSIYLKKISYTYNNDISLSAAFATNQHHNSPGSDRRQSSLQADDAQSSSASTTSSNDLARFAIQNSSNSSKCSNSNCQKTSDQESSSPRGRKNFFQKYRRRSCSMDKYSFEKQQQQQQQQSSFNTPTSKNCSKNIMRFTPPSKLQDFSGSHDEIDSVPSAKNNKSHYHRQQARELQKSMHELSSPPPPPSQSLQWETRQIKVLQAATLDHALKFILLINPSKDLAKHQEEHERKQQQQKQKQSSSSSSSSSSATSTGDNGLSLGSDSALEEERNNVAHIIHVLFCTYRIYTNPYELMMKLMDYSDICRIEQYRFVMHYWMDNYPEDFDYLVDISPENIQVDQSSSSNSTTNVSAPIISNSYNNNSINSYDSSTTTRTVATSDSENSAGIGGGGGGGGLSTGGSQSESENLDRRLSNLSFKTADEKSGVPLVNELLRLCNDDYIRTKALRLNEMKNNNVFDREGSKRGRNNGSSSSSHHNHLTHYQSSGSKNSAVLDLDSRYVAQQLTAIDLENFLSLRPYSLLEGTKSDKRIRSMIKNFNLLSRHVVVTILKSHNPHIVASHWIAIAMNLRKIKNFNSLKAIIAGLTNESIYRLKQVIWSKIDRTSMNNFKLMASIVDDVNNQTVLRQTQLIVEGTAKMSIEDDSFGTIPYLGTFLTDLNMIDARYQSYVPSPKDDTSKLKLINFEKCAKQFEILTQVQLLQKNVLASLHAIQRRNHFDEQSTLNRLKLDFNMSHQMLLAKPAIPQVARLFENWFYDNNVATMTDKQCYEISVTLEQNVISR